jgi:hypothetical protein
LAPLLLLNFPPLEEGVLLKQDLENEEAEEHVDACSDFNFRSS